MNRNELVDTVAGKTELRKAEASKAVDAVFDAIEEALKNGDEVRLVGFGTFSVASRAASEGRNPRTGEKIKIAASKQAKFKPGKGLRRLHRGGRGFESLIAHHVRLMADPYEGCALTRKRGSSTCVLPWD